MKIKLPGSSTCFLLDDKTDSKLFETQFCSVFYPYAIKILFSTQFEYYDVLIKIKKDQLELIRRDGVVFFIRVDSFFTTYKSIFTIIQDNICLQENYCYLHGSAIVIDGEAYLFLAKTGTGKSTLSVFLDHEGYTCLSDDIIILNTMDWSIIPISKYAHIRENSLPLLNKVQNKLKFNENILRYEYLLSDKRFATSYRIKRIFIIDRTGRNFTIYSTEESCMGILENMFLPYQIKQNILSAFQICESIEVKCLEYGDLQSFKQCMSCLTNAS